MQTYFIIGLVIIVCREVDGVFNTSTDDPLDVRIHLPQDNGEESKDTNDKCLFQLHNSLEKLRKRQASSRVASLIDLSGYALHQTLRNAPLDMYVTDIKVRAPSVGSWVQVKGCQFSGNAEMRTQLLFNDLMVSGVVRLLPGGEALRNPTGPPAELCTMSLRLRRAGLDLRASPAHGQAKIVDRGSGLQLRTESNFKDPHFLSVHAYGCRLDQWAREDGTFLPPNYEDLPLTLEDESITRRFSGRSIDDDEPSVRIISLGQEPELEDDGDNELYRQRILGRQPSDQQKLLAMLSVKKQFAQQANAVFQEHGPFSYKNKQPVQQKPQNIQAPQKPLFIPHQPSSTKPHYAYEKPAQSSHIHQSSIVELDDNLKPIRPHAQSPYQTLVNSAPRPPLVQPLPNAPLFAGPQPPLQDVTSEMEDVFLRGAKALLSKYLEKQLEIPLKEALMTKIGYTVSYG